MPKYQLDHNFYVGRLNRKLAAKKAKKAAHKAAVLSRREQTRAANALVKITHLRRKLSRAARFPSKLTVRQLRDIASNSELPAEARVEAARLVTQWLFAEPSELEAAPHGRRRKIRRD